MIPRRNCGWGRFGALVLPLASARVVGAEAGGGFAPDMGHFQREAATLFSPGTFTAADSAFAVASANVLLCFQAIAAIVLVAGLLIQIRREQTQMDGIAATLLKVAFIAAVPALRDLVIEAADAVASSVGYQAVARDGAPSPLMRDLWGLLGQWVPPSTPYLDALEAQSATALPASGAELDWGMRAWNWARGVGVADASQFHALWQATSGSFRALIVFGSCGLMTCGLSATIIFEYLSEVLRVLLFYGGCAIMPLFVAGLSIESLRPACTRFLIGTVVIALWPIGWALANIVTHFVAAGSVSWMQAITARALGPSHLAATPVAVAAPYLAWGVLFLLVGVTIAVCLWALATAFYVPVLMNRAAGAGAGLIAGTVTASGYRSGSPSRLSVAIQTRERAARPPTAASARRSMPPGAASAVRMLARSRQGPVGPVLTRADAFGTARLRSKPSDPPS